ncbi:MAG: adenosylcobinamide amidohydrolase, partial [Desulfococcaceae bacterium]
GREAAATELVEEIRAELAHTARKVATVPASRKKRVLRFMGRDRVMTPGADAFQNEMIRLAGGVPPDFGKLGGVVPVTLEEWRSFNPQVIYGCGGDRKAARTLLDRPGWRDVDAVRNGAIRYYPCDLTCRLSTRTGHFVSCLAAEIHAETFAQTPPVTADGVTGSRPVPLDLPYVEASEIVESTVNDYTHKTLLLHLETPMDVSSTLEGFRRNIRHVGNSYSPPQCWALYHRIGLKTSRKQLLRAIGRDGTDTSLLFTGADMDNLSVQRRRFKEMTVYALVTAGVRSNAVRMAEDIGAFYEPGTINMILLSNMRLTPRAMNRAIISATEAKTAALWDMDIRSAYTPLTNPATGTGTDNIIVAEGAGPSIDNAGGHTKMGELIAKAVYIGVQEAVFKQNGIVPNRTVFQRLKERGVSLFGMAGDCTCGLDKYALAGDLEALLLTSRYAGFIETALAVSDQYERGLATDIAGFQDWCNRVSEEIAGRRIEKKHAATFAKPLPPVLTAAFEALLSGLAAKTETENQ